MPGYDRSRRYPPRGVWFGLILAAMTVRALVAQDALDEARPGAGSTTRSRWLPTASRTGTGPTDTGFTSGAMSSVLHGSDRSYARGKRSYGSATNRRSSIRSRGSRFTPRAWCDRHATTAPPQRVGRAALRTSEIRLKSYQPNGLERGQEPSLAVADHQALRASREEAPPAVANVAGNGIAIRRRSIPTSRP